MSTASDLDKYYTKKTIARECIDAVYSTLPHNINYIYVEPSAGAGAFFHQLEEENSLGYDIAPEGVEIRQLDFLNDPFPMHLRNKSNTIFIGNPPFGKKGILALAFLNRALVLGDTVAFIVPIQFRKWSIQSKIVTDVKLVYDQDLPEKAFELEGKDFRLRCVFQIWTRLNAVKLPDLRLSDKPKTDHPDFEMWQYNRTDGALKFFNYDWDFAVPRQGYCDYTLRVTGKEDCDRKKQWIFFKAKNTAIKERLLGIDFERLSKNNSATPGFGKADVIREYAKND
jgi:hypothetical protein